MPNFTQERDCSPLEAGIRTVYSNIFYHGLYRKKHPDHPYYTPKAIEWLDNYMAGKECKVFEYGSGASTRWYTQKAEQLVTVEDNQEWYDKGKSYLEKNGIKNVELILAPPGDPETEFQHPEIKKNQFLNYARAIEKFEDNYFDIVAIDGRERFGCLFFSHEKVREDGLIILDDSMRPKYKPIFEFLKDWNHISFDYGLLQTTIFSKRNL